MVNDAFQKSAEEIIAGLRQIGYRDALLQENYSFRDWFTTTGAERTVVAAAFGQTPISYESALIGVAQSNGIRGESLVNGFRALGAPILLEIDGAQVREWAVSSIANRHGLIETYPATQIRGALIRRAQDWKPESLLRAKNIGSFQWHPQLGLFSGLLPELEEQIQTALDPLLRNALSAAQNAYRKTTGREPGSESLFKLVFWLLTAKVFSDRRVPGFLTLKPDPDAVLAAIAKQYKTQPPKLLNREAREAAMQGIWTEMDFRNLSVEVLAQIWSMTLVDAATRKRLGIHRTSRTIVRYIVERIPFSSLGDDERIVFEPCCGSASFLIGAMNHLRHNLFGASPEERHKYFAKHLAGVEQDPFGVEISGLALTLADFPNPNGWGIVHRDVFANGAIRDFLKRAGVVLCNPPFEDFDDGQRRRYDVTSSKKPVELLHRVLNDLHPSGVLGFVLPRNAIDGRGYSQIRRRLADRFGAIALTALPDRAFEADAEVALLIATDPIPHDVCRISFHKVDDNAAAWERFEREQTVSSTHSSNFSVGEAEEQFSIPDLPELWEYLVNYPILANYADTARGIEWNKPLTEGGDETGHRTRLIRKECGIGYKQGVAPKTKFSVFEVPKMSYLSMRPEDQRGNSWKAPWDLPKAILNKATKSRGHWRIAAFPDHVGVVCYQTFIGLWPKSNLDETLLSAVLNGPVANAYVATREGKTDITLETLRLIPVPLFNQLQRERIKTLVSNYQALLMRGDLADSGRLEHILKEIDAAVLDGYRLPPRVERQLLDFFRGHDRPISHTFGEYIPLDVEVYFSLSEFLSPEFSASTTSALLQRRGRD
ncbi:MAG: N-6 DNA methylase [Nitrospira sp.]|nr:N-6 DNA methylase [Nitrospira sp.]